MCVCVCVCVSVTVFEGVCVCACVHVCETFGRKSILSSIRILSGVTLSRASVLAGALLQTQHGPGETAEN